jgi:hypothetical protein
MESAGCSSVLPPQKFRREKRRGLRRGSAPAAAADNDGITVTILDPWIIAEMEAGRLKPAVIIGDMNEMHLCAAQLSFGLQCKPA